MQLVYAHTVEGLFFKAVRSRIGPGLKARLKPMGIDLDGQPADVPRETWAEDVKMEVLSFDGHPASMNIKWTEGT